MSLSGLVIITLSNLSSEFQNLFLATLKSPLMILINNLALWEGKESIVFTIESILVFMYDKLILICLSLSFSSSLSSSEMTPALFETFKVLFLTEVISSLGMLSSVIKFVSQILLKKLIIEFAFK